MGLSFHYSGRIATPESLSRLIDEIEDIANTFKWKYKIFNRHFPDNAFGMPDYNHEIYGICFTPTGCETIPICFLSNGRLSDYTHLRLYGKTEQRVEHGLLYILSVKTQFAGVELHQFLIHLFRYLNTKYFTGFTFSDEGNYWETNDLAVLQATFRRYTNFINSFTSALEHIPMQRGENLEIYFERLLKLLSDRKNPDE